MPSSTELPRRGHPFQEALQCVDPPLPRVVRRRLDPRPPKALAQLEIRQQPPDRLRHRPRVGLGHQAVLAVATEVAVAVRVGAHHRPTRRHRLQRRQREALVHGGLHEHRGLAEQLVDLLVVGSLDVAHAFVGGDLRLDPEQYELRARLLAAAERPPGVERERQVLQRVRPPQRQHHVLATLHIRARAERVEVDARRDQLRVEAQLAQALAVPGGDRHVAELGAIGVEHRVTGALVVRVVARLDVLHEVHGDAIQHARAPHGRGCVPPRRHLDRLAAARAPPPVRRSTRSCARAPAAQTSPAARPGCRGTTSCPRSASRLRCSKMSRCPPPMPVSSVTYATRSLPSGVRTSRRVEEIPPQLPEQPL